MSLFWLSGFAVEKGGKIVGTYFCHLPIWFSQNIEDVYVRN